MSDAMEKPQRRIKLSDLPHDIVILIAEHTGSDCAINALCQTNRFLYQHLSEYLYLHNAKWVQKHLRTRWALLWAAKYGHEDTARLALKPYRTLGLKSIEPQMAAAKRGHVKVLDLIIALDSVDIDARDNNGFSVLDIALMEGQTTVVKHLLDAGASPEPTGAVLEKMDMFPLFAAIDDSRSDAIKALVSTGKIDLEKPAHKGQTPLWHACWSTRIEIVECLLECGAKPDPVLNYAIMHGHIEIVKLLLAYGADINQVDKGYHNRTPIYLAVHSSRAAIIQLLIESDAGVDLNQLDDEGQTPLTYAIVNQGSTREILLLLASGQGLDPNIGGAFPRAIEHDCVELATTLLFSSLLTSRSKYEGLQVAIKNNSENSNELIRAILESGVELATDHCEALLKCASDVENWTALDLLQEWFEELLELPSS